MHRSRRNDGGHSSTPQNGSRMYTIESRVRYSECDVQGNLSLVALTNYLQDCSTFHSEDIGRGVDYMGERNIAWFIAAWQIEIERLPHFNERISINTWCHTMSHTLASRNYVICDAGGNTLVRADSLWFVFDFDQGRPVRITEEQHVYLSDEPALDMPPTKRRFKASGIAEEAPQLTVSRMHLDTNLHVNNAQYLNMAEDALACLRKPNTSKVQPRIRRLCIQYQQQAHLGDVIYPRIYRKGNTDTVDLVDGNGRSFATVHFESADDEAPDGVTQA